MKTSTMKGNDKCDFCALRVIFDQNAVQKAIEVESYFTSLRNLQASKKIAKGFSRRVHVNNGGNGDISEICAVNSSFWDAKKAGKKCPSFTLNTGQLISEALALHSAKESEKTAKQTKCITTISVLIAFLAFGVTVYQVFKGSPQHIEKHDTTILKIEIK